MCGGGLVKIPDDIPFEQAAFIEPVNTCFKAVRLLELKPDETVLVIGQGPIGILLAALAQRTGATVLTSDLYPERHAVAAQFGLDASDRCAGRCGGGGEGGDRGPRARMWRWWRWAACADPGGDGRDPAGRAGDAVCQYAAWRGAVRSGGGVHG